MQTKFKRQQKVKLISTPNPEYTEYHTENTDDEEIPIVKGMTGKVNIILPNGQYHVVITDKKGNELAYVKVDEEELEAID